MIAFLLFLIILCFAVVWGLPILAMISNFLLIVPIAIVTGIGAWFGYTPRPVAPKAESEDVHLRIIYLYDVLNNIDDIKFNGGPGPSFEDWLNNRIWIESYERRNRRKRVVEWKGFYITQIGQEHIFVRTEPQS